jgi:hypothetical protein
MFGDQIKDERTTKTAEAFGGFEQKKNYFGQT